ncbi:MAG: sensor histidine kinase, partial [Flavobacteriaceae bacterium]
KAIQQYQKALEIARQAKNKMVELKLLQSLADSHTRLQKTKEALTYSKLYFDLKDSIEATYQKTIEIKDQYEEALKREQLLEKDNKIAEAEVKKMKAEFQRKNILILSLLVGLALVLLLFFSIFNTYREKQKLRVAERDKKLQEQQISELLKNQELRSLNIMMESQENERKRIAQELHDHLGSMLSMVKIHFKSVEDHIEQLKASNLEQYQKANALLDDACDEVRKIAHDMSSGVLAKFGLVPALEDLCQTLEKSNQIEVEFIAHGLDDRLEKDLEIAAYRIVQELVSNILKHAKATSISLQLINNGKKLNLIVEDNGIGFNATDKTILGMGLRSVRQRVDVLNGELLIDSSPGNGSTITINIPITEAS